MFFKSKIYDSGLTDFLRLTSDLDLPPPEVLVEEDGDLCFDWSHAPRHTVSVSVNPRGYIGWAAVVGDWVGHGTCYWSASDELTEALRRYAMSQKPSCA
jgi:hypothetical protein